METMNSYARICRLLARLPLLALVLAAGCGPAPIAPPSALLPTANVIAARPTVPPASIPTRELATAVPTPTTPPAPSATPAPTPAADLVLVAAGDIAACGADGAGQTARLLDQIEGTVLTLGDNAYDSGTAEQFRNCYDPTWGRHKARTRPSPGNHDYVTPGAAAYFDYFGESAGPDR